MAVPLLIAVEQKMVSLHTFAASGGIGAATYTWAAGNSLGYFDLDATSGVLSLSAEAVAGKYTLTVRVTDARDNRVEAMVRANISAALSLADAPRLFAAKEVAMSLHTFVASGGLGVKTYTLVAGAEYFTVGSASGVLSVNDEVPIAVFTLSVRVADADGTMADAVATVEAVSLLLAGQMLYEIVGRKVDLHTLAAVGGSGAKVYMIVAGNDDDYFGIDAGSGVLSVQGNPTVAIYTLSVAVDDSIGSSSTAQVLVEVRPSLSVVEAPLLTVAAGKASLFAHFCHQWRHWRKNLYFDDGRGLFCFECRQWRAVFASQHRQRVLYADGGGHGWARQYRQGSGDGGGVGGAGAGGRAATYGCRQRGAQFTHLRRQRRHRRKNL